MAARRKASKKTGRREADALETELPGDIAAVLDELGTEGTTIQLHRRANDAPGSAERYGYVTTYAAEDIAPGSFFERVKGEWGGGRYQARVFSADRKQPVRMRNFTIDSAFDRPEPRPDPAAGTSGVLMDMVRELRRDLEDMRRQRAQPAGGDSLETAMKIATMIQAQNTDTMKLLVEMAKGGGRSTPTAEILGGVREVLALSKELGGGGGEGPEPYPFAGVIEHFGKPLLERLGKLADAERARTNIPPVPQLEPAHPEPSTVNRSDFPEWVQTVAPWVPQLVELAATGSDPELWAAVVIDRSDDHAQNIIADALALPRQAMATQFFTAFPDAAETPERSEWFYTFFARLDDGLLESDAAAQDVTPAPEGAQCGVLGCTLEVGHDGEHFPVPSPPADPPPSRMPASSGT